MINACLIRDNYNMQKIQKYIMYRSLHALKRVNRTGINVVLK